MSLQFRLTVTAIIAVCSLQQAYLVGRELPRSPAARHAVTITSVPAVTDVDAPRRFVFYNNRIVRPDGTWFVPSPGNCSIEIGGQTYGWPERPDGSCWMVDRR